MIDAITAIANAMNAAGCTQIFYESDKLANITMDESLQSNIIGLIVEPNEITLNIKANAIQEQYSPIYVEVLHQVRLETEAVNNAAIYEMLLAVCKKIVYKLIEFAQDEPYMFAKLLPMTITKVIESKYDANVIGWSMPFRVIYLKNEDHCPVTSP